MASVTKREWVGPKGEKKSAYVVRYTDLTGKRHIETFKLQKQADRRRREIEAEIDRGEHTPAGSSPYIKDLAAEYLDHLRAQKTAGMVGDGHYYNSEAALRLIIVPMLGHIRITDLTIVHVTSLTRHMLEEKQLSNRTTIERRDVLKRMEDWAGVMGYTKKRITFDSKKAFRIKKDKKIRIPSKAEIRSILLAAGERSDGARKQRGERLAQLHINLAAFCGLRYGEIAGLTVSSVDLTARLIKVRHSMTSYGKHKGPKTESGNRDVPCPAQIIEDLRSWIDSDRVPNKRDLIFTSAQGGPLQGANWHEYYWGPLLRRLGLYPDDADQRIHFHALRHFAGSWWLENGVSLPIVSKWLGHATPEMTLKVYAHVINNADDRQQAMDRVSASLVALAA